MSSLWQPSQFYYTRSKGEAEYPDLYDGLIYALTPSLCTSRGTFIPNLFGSNVATFGGTYPPYYNHLYYNMITFYSGINDQHINCGQVLNFTSQNFTITIFINIYALAGGQGPIPFYKGSFQNDGYYSAINPDGSVIFVTNQSGVYQISSTPAGSIVAGQIYCISFVRNGASIRIYINGLDRTSSAGTHINPTSSSNNFQIGRYGSNFFQQDFHIYDFIVHNKPLSLGSHNILSLAGPGGWAIPKRKKRVSMLASSSRIKNIFMGGIITGNTKKVFTDYNIMTGVQ